MPRQSSNDVLLKIELFPNGEDQDFQVNSKVEGQFIFRALAQKKSRVALYYDGDKSFTLTTVLGVGEQGVWLEAGRNPEDNLLLAQSKRIIFVSSHNNVKIQFVTQHATMLEFDGMDAIYLPLPETVLRIQRRDYYRLPTPTLNPLKCVIPVKPGHPPNKRDTTIMDISCGGVALVCEESNTELLEGHIYHNCQITLPDNTVTVSIQVIHTFLFTLPSGESRKRAGCRFIDLDGKTTILLQRYITQQQQI